MAEYKIVIQNRIASVEGGVKLVCNNPTDSIRFEFDEEWSGKTVKTARFSWEENKIDVPFSGNVVKVPEIFRTNYVFIGVFTDDLATTPVKVNCRYSIKCLGSKPVPPSEDVYNEIIALINDGITVNDSFTPRPFEASGKLVQLDNFEGMPMNAVTRIEPAQAGSGEPSPSNIRPISGRAGAKLTRCGKNLLPNVREATETYGGITFTNHGDGSYTLDGTANAYVQFVDTASFWLAPGTYVLSGGYGTTSQLRSADGLTTFGHSDGSPFTFNVATEVRFRQTLGAGSIFNGRRFYPQLELGSTATRYEPYQGETFSASFGQTVYGGTLDWNTGVLTVDRAIVTLTGTENSVERNTTENAHYIRYNYFGLTQSAIADGAFCSHFKTRLNTDVGDQLTNTFEIHSSILYPIFRVSASLYPTDDVWKSYLAAQKAAGTPVQVCYKLATPTTIQLTPAQLTALQGMNNIFCDAGETTVSGRKDILWLTSGLIEQIDTLKKAIISLGGNV